MADFHPFIFLSLSVMVILWFGNLSKATPVFVMTAKISLKFEFICNLGNYKRHVHIWLSVSKKPSIVRHMENIAGFFLNSLVT